MEQKQIDRINELAKKAKSPEGLTEWRRWSAPPCGGNTLIPCWAI